MLMCMQRSEPVWCIRKSSLIGRYVSGQHDISMRDTEAMESDETISNLEARIVEMKLDFEVELTQLSETVKVIEASQFFLALAALLLLAAFFDCFFFVRG